MKNVEVGRPEIILRSKFAIVFVKNQRLQKYEQCESASPCVRTGSSRFRFIHIFPWGFRFKGRRTWPQARQSADPEGSACGAGFGLVTSSS